MTTNDFRRIALSMPKAVESSHMAHPDFRLVGKIFATLGYPDKDHGIVVLPPEEQTRLVQTYPKVFSRAEGAWGLRGCTCVRLEPADSKVLRAAVTIAWRRKAPKRLISD